MRKGLLDGPQNMTLLDGEMVVDEDIVTGQRKRRYLAYDVMLLHGKSIIDLPFKVCQNKYIPASLLYNAIPISSMAVIHTHVAVSHAL